MKYHPIANYGVIGNLQTVALAGMDGSIDFMSFPYFDSPTIFAKLVDAGKGGCFRIAPTFQEVHCRQLYLSDSNILITRFLADGGVAEVSDFMPIALEHDGPQQNPPHQLVRRVKAVRGDLEFRMQCGPRFDYARAAHKVERVSPHEILFIAQGGPRLTLRLYSPEVEIREVDGDGFAEFKLRHGHKAAFIMEEVRETAETNVREPDFVTRRFKETLNFWQGWAARGTYRGRWRETVNRSALTLKMLTSQRHGSIVAAPTFGLPEVIGGGRNWDYRYTWIRDASFTLYALNRLGYNDEATGFMSWIEARCGECRADGGLQLMYGLDGRADLTEIELPHLEGYRGSAPVRIGNGAYDQLQLDIYGELMDSVYLYNKYGKPIDYDFWLDLARLLDWLCENYRQPDAGIWEVRGGRQEFLYSRLMCWVAVDRGIRLAQKRSFPTPPARWFAVRDEIYREIYRDFWDHRRGAFIQARGKYNVDASALMMPMVKFISPSDRRWLSAMKAIDEDLVRDSLVYRYRDGDGLDGDEGTFCMCSFWYIECLARGGDLRKARFLLEKMLGYANPLGLYAEELGPNGDHLGNFPQAFTHLGLISAIYNLDRLMDNPRAVQ